MLPLCTQIVYHKRPREKKTNRFAWTFNVDWRWREQTYGQLEIATYKTTNTHTNGGTHSTPRYISRCQSKQRTEEIKQQQMYTTQHSAPQNQFHVLAGCFVGFCSAQFTQTPNTGHTLSGKYYMAEHKIYIRHTRSSTCTFVTGRRHAVYMPNE